MNNKNIDITKVSDLDLGILFAKFTEEKEKVFNQLSIVTNELASRANKKAQDNKTMDEEVKVEGVETVETPVEETDAKAIVNEEVIEESVA